MQELHVHIAIQYRRGPNATIATLNTHLEFNSEHRTWITNLIRRHASGIEVLVLRLKTGMS